MRRILSDSRLSDGRVYILYTVCAVYIPTCVSSAAAAWSTGMPTLSRIWFPPTLTPHPNPPTGGRRLLNHPLGQVGPRTSSNAPRHQCSDEVSIDQATPSHYLTTKLHIDLNCSKTDNLRIISKNESRISSSRINIPCFSRAPSFDL